MNFVFAGP